MFHFSDGCNFIHSKKKKKKKLHKTDLYMHNYQERERKRYYNISIKYLRNMNFIRGCFGCDFERKLTLRTLTKTITNAYLTTSNKHKTTMSVLCLCICCVHYTEQCRVHKMKHGKSGLNEPDFSWSFLWNYSNKHMSIVFSFLSYSGFESIDF